jgi:histidinol-phosphate aminotransferase
MVSLVPEFENLIVLRTFSKWAGLAGLRVGFGVMSQALVELLMTIKPPYTPNVAAEVAAIESLADWETAITRIDAIKLERSRLFDALKKLPFLEPIESEANFILCRVLDGDARLITQRLAERGIFIRYFDNKLMRDYIRISVGLPQHTDLLLEALLEIGAVNA